MRVLTCFFLLYCLMGTTASKADENFSVTPTMTPTFESTMAALEAEKKKLEIERIELENEKLKMEMEKTKIQETPVLSGDDLKAQEKKQLADYQETLEKKSENLAKENKDKEDLLVLDFVDAEVWFKGVKYSINEWDILTDDQKWKARKYMDKRDPWGNERNVCAVHNASLMKYVNRSRGIFTVGPITKEGDFHFLTPEGISFESSEGDVRNAYQGLYFKINGEHREKELKIVKFKHSNGDFDDKLEIGFNKDGKLTQIRFGVLDEN